MDRTSRRLLLLYGSLFSGDFSVADEIAELVLFRVAARLLQQYSSVDRDLVWDSVTDAVLDFLRRPQIFDIGRGVPIEVFLCAYARRSMAHKLRSEERRRKRLENLAECFNEDFVELGSFAGNMEIESQIEFSRGLEGVLEIPADRKIFELCVDGERSTEVFARALGISELPLEERRRAVKRAKDRILKRVRRKLKRRHSID